jgi:hypothetical protein
MDNYLTLNKLIEETYTMLNDIVIVNDEVGRFVGIMDDGEDFYYTYIKMGGKIRNCTAVTWCESLKGVLDQRHYDSIDKTFELNGAAKVSKFLVLSDYSISEEQNNENEFVLRKIFGEN